MSKLPPLPDCLSGLLSADEEDYHLHLSSISDNLKRGNDYLFCKTKRLLKFIDKLQKHEQFYQDLDNTPLNEAISPL